MKDLKLEKSEKCNDEDCYVVSGRMPVGQKETLWIAKSNYPILKLEHSTDSPDKKIDMPEFTEEQLTEAIKEMGQTVNDKSKQQLRSMMDLAKQTMTNVRIKTLSIEVHKNISAPKVESKDFECVLPKDVVVDSSLLDFPFPTEFLKNKK